MMNREIVKKVSRAVFQTIDTSFFNSSIRSICLFTVRVNIYRHFGFTIWISFRYTFSFANSSTKFTKFLTTPKYDIAINLWWRTDNNQISLKVRSCNLSSCQHGADLFLMFSETTFSVSLWFTFIIIVLKKNLKI
jgi:hypothetical protein